MKVPAFFSVNRTAGAGTHNIGEVFSGLGQSPALRKIFGSSLRAGLSRTKVRVTRGKWYYSWVDPKNGNIVVSGRQLRYGKLWVLYLDIIHELAHVRQWHQGKELYDTRYHYVNSPIEIAAYKVTVAEARRLGARREQVARYLKVPWISKAECLALVKKVW